MQKNNILITSAGRRVSLVKSFKKELQKISPGGKVYTGDFSPGISVACNISDGAFQLPEVTCSSYINKVFKLCKEHDIGMVIPTIDTELPVFAQAKNRFKKEGISIIVSSPSLIKTCWDKRKTQLFFQKIGISTPEIYDREDLEFPAYVKPYNGSSSEKNYIIWNEREMTNELKENEDFLFYEYLNQEFYNEYTIDLYYDKQSNLKSIVPRKRIQVRGGEVSKGLTIKNHLIPYVKNKMGTVEGARGSWNLQVFVHEQTDEIKGIEINPRFGGGYPLSYLANANYPKWLLREYWKDEELTYDESWESNLLMLRYDDEVLVHGFKVK